MAIKAKALTINFLVWDTSNNVGKTGDSANITLNIIKDGGASASLTNTITEPTSANMPGVYEVALTTTEMTADFITVGGKSSTADSVVFPVFIQTDQGDIAVIDTNVDTINSNVVTIDTNVDTINSNVVTIDTNVDTINISTSGTDTLINALNDISTTDVNTTITNNTTIGTLSTEANATSNVSTINGNTDTKISALNDVSTTEVKTQVTNAITVDAISELSQATPSATPSLANAIMLAYMDLRNKRTATSDEYGIYNNAGTKIAKATLSDDNTTFTKAELTTGA